MDDANHVSIGQLDAVKGRVTVMSAFTEDDRERYAELAKLSADMEKRYNLSTVKIDRFKDDEIITFRNVAAKFLKGWGRAEIRSGKIIKNCLSSNNIIYFDSFYNSLKLMLLIDHAVFMLLIMEKLKMSVLKI